MFASRLISSLLSLDYRVHSAATSDLGRLTPRYFLSYRIEDIGYTPGGLSPGKSSNCDCSEEGHGAIGRAINSSSTSSL